MYNMRIFVLFGRYYTHSPPITGIEIYVYGYQTFLYIIGILVKYNVDQGKNYN